MNPSLRRLRCPAGRLVVFDCARHASAGSRSSMMDVARVSGYAARVASENWHGATLRPLIRTRAQGAIARARSRIATSGTSS